MYSDIHLSRRLERTEARAAAAHVEAHARIDPRCGAEWRDIGGAIALFDGPDSPITQSFCLGVNAVPTAESLDELETFFRDRGAPVMHETSPMADKALWPLLGDRGYRPIEFSAMMFQRVTTPPQISSRVTTRVVHTPADRRVWIETAVEGWRGEAGLDSILFDLMRVVEQRRDVVLFLAEIDHKPISAGALDIHEGAALFSGAATIPSARGQGGQAALLNTRMAYAANVGCDIAVMIAEAGSSSQRNAQRSGFQIAYTRVKWLLQKD